MRYPGEAPSQSDDHRRWGHAAGDRSGQDGQSSDNHRRWGHAVGDNNAGGRSQGSQGGRNPSQQ